MSSQAIERQDHSLAEWRSPSQVKQRIQAIQQLMAEVLKPGTDYGKIPNLAKDAPPSLFKPGSEQILAMFQIAVEPVVEDLSEPDCFRFRVLARMTHAPTGQYLGSGVGECSSMETKYKWRKTYSEKEYTATDPERRRMKFGRFKNGQGKWQEFEEMQVRQEPADLANTILKMAKKRAQIDGTLTVTAASSMFQQDLEDMPAEVVESFDDGTPIEEPNAPIKPTTKKASTATSSGPHAPQAESTPGKGQQTQPADVKYINEGQLKRLFAIQGEAGMSDGILKQWLATKGVNSRKFIPVTLYEETINFIDPEFAHHERPE